MSSKRSSHKSRSYHTNNSHTHNTSSHINKPTTESKTNDYALTSASNTINSDSDNKGTVKIHKESLSCSEYYQRAYERWKHVYLRTSYSTVLY